MAEFQLICLVVHTVFYRQNKYNTHINTECPSVQAHSLLFSHGRQWFSLPCFCNIFKSKYIWMTLTRLTKHQKATRGHVCCLRSEMNEWPLQSFTCFWNHYTITSRWTLSFGENLFSTLNAPAFFGKKKDRIRLHFKWGSDFFLITKTKSCDQKCI